jgi:hypothetical protein
VKFGSDIHINNKKKIKLECIAVIYKMNMPLLPFHETGKESRVGTACRSVRLKKKKKNRGQCVDMLSKGINIKEKGGNTARSLMKH